MNPQQSAADPSVNPRLFAASHAGELVGPKEPIKIAFSVDPMIPEDLPAVTALMDGTPGVSIKEWETPDLMERALKNNAGFNWIARSRDGAILGASFVGNTGFRVSFHHVTVREEFRGQGIGSKLVDETVEVMRRVGVLRVINTVEDGNEGAIKFWLRRGFRISTERGGVVVQMTRDLEPVAPRG